MTLRIGILGAARIAELAIVGPAHDLGYRLVAIGARDPLRAKLFAEKYGVERAVDSYADVLADPEVDVIYNPLANSLHAPWNLAAVAAGKPTLTEKPYARNQAEARQVAAASAASGVPVIEAFHHVHHPVTRRMLDLAGGSEIGRLRHIEVRMEMPPPADDDPRWRLDLAGGALMDLGCYGLQFVRAVAAARGVAPRIVEARAVECAAGVDESCTVDLSLGEVTARSVNSMVAAEQDFRITLIGSAGSATAHNFIKPHGDDRITVRTADGERVEHLGTRTSYSWQLEKFAATVIAGAPLPVSIADPVANMSLVDAAYTAAGLPLR
ncbi:Gfo/Idh/MocA family protein [Mycolicibacterium confluentis]|uniref:Oxidoreductase n=1 Tax=Mycolicibacterium confluentis TaxID=28047 RepID=A0A7I7XU31_9MYCO|nr:Gfo/Idh/MocA family oxidoreductase [Mycolicibacterium confluentis]MCV7320844.1 Gfo/Idh/MocA family oxidoreductase [Mycolicibacterium confluentis]ORV27107.1 oxidoreductase [Mycolicibacterium confluentis]BBZ32755.1 oxidoreductase [Mycolicibacterium confluentis]